jgi:hypothetical protein
MHADSLEPDHACPAQAIDSSDALWRCSFSSMGRYAHCRCVARAELRPRLQVALVQLSCLEALMDNRLHLLDSFVARASDGSVHKVFSYERRVVDPNVPYPDRWEPSGLMEYRLDNGEHVVVRRDGSMQTSRSGIYLEPL